MKNIILVAAMLLSSTTMVAQATWEDNDPNANIPLGYLGWDDNTNINLDINQNNTLRQRFTSVNWTGINGAADNNASRIHIGLDGNFMNPFSLIHMGSDITTDIYRPWMNVGVTMIASEDILHLGLLERPDSSDADQQVDAVLAWGCQPNEGTAGPDNFRFLFIQPTTVFPAGPGTTQQGLETMRITPVGNIGIGDFSTMPTGLDEQPTHRLDVDGTARLRQMPNDTMDVIITGVYAEEPNVDGDFVLNYSTIEDFTNNICEWNEVTNDTNDDLVMGYGGACNQGRVGIGVSNPFNSKLRVLQETPSGSTNFGTSSFAFGAASPVFGIYGYAQTSDEGDGGMQNI